MPHAAVLCFHSVPPDIHTSQLQFLKEAERDRQVTREPSHPQQAHRGHLAKTMKILRRVWIMASALCAMHGALAHQTISHAARRACLRAAPAAATTVANYQDNTTLQKTEETPTHSDVLAAPSLPRRTRLVVLPSLSACLPTTFNI